MKTMNNMKKVVLLLLIAAAGSSAQAQGHCGRPNSLRGRHGAVGANNHKTDAFPLRCVQDLVQATN